VSGAAIALRCPKLARRSPARSAESHGGEARTTALEIAARFVDFEGSWSPFLGGQGPAPVFAMSLARVSLVELSPRTLRRPRLTRARRSAADLARATVPYLAQAEATDESREPGREGAPRRSAQREHRRRTGQQRIEHRERVAAAVEPTANQLASSSSTTNGVPPRLQARSMIEVKPAATGRKRGSSPQRPCRARCATRASGRAARESP
jgi:hypothetical protein